MKHAEVGHHLHLRLQRAEDIADRVVLAASGRADYHQVAPSPSAAERNRLGEVVVFLHEKQSNVLQVPIVATIHVEYSAIRHLTTNTRTCSHSFTPSLVYLPSWFVK